MKFLSKPNLIIGLVGILFLNGNATASVSYNITGWDATGTGGADGGFPANWVGGVAPGYIGSLNAMWFADVAVAGSETVSSSAARSISGVDPT